MQGYIKSIVVWEKPSKVLLCCISALVYCILIKHLQDYVCSTFINMYPKQANSLLARVPTNEKKNYNTNRISLRKSSQKASFINKFNWTPFVSLFFKIFCISHGNTSDNRIDWPNLSNTFRLEFFEKHSDVSINILGHVLLLNF